MVLAQELRKTILLAAISGHLTKQKSSDGIAEDLLAQIYASHPTKKKYTLDAFPFDIPDNWSWCSLSDLGVFSSGKTPDMSNPDFWEKGTVQWFTSKDMKNKYLVDSKMKVTEQAKKDMKYYLAGTLLMVVRSGILKHTLPICILTVDATINQDIKAFVPYENAMSEYLYWMLKGLETNILQNYTKRVTTVDSLRFDDFTQKMPVPIPPLAEQQRIVERLNELLVKVDEYEEIEQQLIVCKKKFPTDMRDAILQAAIQGKLTKQLQADSSVDKMLITIAKEKECFIENHKIKQEKPLPKITNEEIPFEIPETWRWVRWGNLSNSIQYGYNAPAKFQGRIRMLRISDIKNNMVAWETVPFCNIAEKDIETYLLEENDILFARTGGTVGKSYLVTDMNVEAIYAGYLIRSNYNKRLCPQYLKYFMESPLYWQQLQNGTTQTAQPNCNGKTLAKMLIPLPPIEEQYRIVERLDALLPLSENLL